MTRIVQKFKDGDEAETFMIEKYFPSLGLKFQKIKKDGNPDGWIIHKEKIALSEIKLILEKDFHLRRHQQFARKHKSLYRNIRKQIRKAKKQLKRITTNLPKVLYLIIDSSVINFESVLTAAFGPQIICDVNGKTVFNRRGFHPRKKLAQDDALRDGTLSGIICYIPSLKNNKLWIIENTLVNNLPKELLVNVEKHIKYNNAVTSQIAPNSSYPSYPILTTVKPIHKKIEHCS